MSWARPSSSVFIAGNNESIKYFTTMGRESSNGEPKPEYLHRSSDRLGAINDYFRREAVEHSKDEIFTAIKMTVYGGKTEEGQMEADIESALQLMATVGDETDRGRVAQIREILQKPEERTT